MIIEKQMAEDGEGNSCGANEVMKNTTSLCSERYSKWRNLHRCPDFRVIGRK